MTSIFRDSENRKKERNRLLTSLKNSINTFVFGSQGIGKTTLIKSIVEDYCDKTGEGVYIDCSLYQTANATLRETLLSLGNVVASKSNYDLVKRLKKKAERVRFAVFLDHCEHLKTHEIIRILLGLNVPFCMVAASFDNYKRMDLALKSRITNVMRIPPFTEEAILEILKERASCHISEDILYRIVQKSNGNLSFAINVLAAIANMDYAQAMDYISFLRDTEDEKLARDKSLLLEILQESQSLPSGELYQLYCEKLEHPKSERSFRKYMQALCKQGLVKSIGEKKGRMYEIIEDKTLGRF